MKAMKYVKAAGSFCSTLFARGAKVQGMSSSGFPVMEGWKTAPEETWLSNALSGMAGTGVPRYALFCFQGTHSGEVFFLTQATTCIGASSNAAIVLTSGNEREAGLFHLDIQPVPRLRAQSGTSFMLNGRQVGQADLFDYDEVDLYGNRFLVLDLFNEARVAPDSLAKGNQGAQGRGSQ